jgi:hypothetical protein
LQHRLRAWTGAAEQRLERLLERPEYRVALPEIYRWQDGNYTHELCRFPMLLHGVARLCRLTALADLTPDPELARLAEDLDGLAPELFWMAMAFAEAHPLR